MAEKTEKKQNVREEKPEKKIKEQVPETAEKKEAKKPEAKMKSLRSNISSLHSEKAPKKPGTGEWGVIKFPHLSEKSIANIEAQNKLVFIVKDGASRKEIKDAVERIFQVKVTKVNMLTTAKGEKKAFVRLDEKNSASDIATRLGMM